MPLLSRLALETGFTTLSEATGDAKLMCVQRFVRLFAYGASFLILIQFLSDLGISDQQIGLFLTLTLLGDAVISFFLTLMTDQIGRRLVLAVGAASMVASGAIFALSSQYWLLLLASIIGVISPSGNEIGPFRAVEESILAHLTDKKQRTDIYTWYSLCGTAGSALGSLVCGWTLQILQDKYAWKAIEADRIIFAGYAVAGGIKLLCTLCLSRSVESPAYQQAGYQALPQQENTATEGATGEDGNAVESQPPAPPRETRAVASVFPRISWVSWLVLAKLLLLFTLDSFASGLASPSWMTYFFTSVHHLSPSTLGTLFLVTNILATLSNFAALPLARRIGPLLTMCFTHLPSAIFLGLIPFPSPATDTGRWFAMLFLSLRACTQSMDQAPRQAFLSAAVLPHERTAILGFVNVGKTLAQAGGAGVSGILAGGHMWQAMFGGAGALKASYDLLMLAMFLGMRDREDVAAEETSAS